MKNYTAMIWNGKQSVTVAINANSLSAAKTEFEKMGTVLLYSLTHGGGKINS